MLNYYYAISIELTSEVRLHPKLQSYSAWNSFKIYRTSYFLQCLHVKSLYSLALSSSNENWIVGWQEGKKKRQQGLWFTSALPVWVFFWKWTNILKKIKSDLTSERNQYFLQSTSQNKSCHNLFQKEQQQDWNYHASLGQHVICWSGLANSCQRIWHASPSTSFREIRCCRMTDMLALKRDSTEFNSDSLVDRSLYSSAHIWMWRAITGDQ